MKIQKITKNQKNNKNQTNGKMTNTYQNNGQPKINKKCQPADRDMADLIQTAQVPNSRLARPTKKTIKPKMSKNKKKTSDNNKYCYQKKVIKTKKCQPAARDMADLIKTAHVPNSGLARHTKKTIKPKMYKNQKKASVKNCLNYQKMGVKKTKKCQPAAGDMADLIQTAHVPNSRLARPPKKISERKKSNKIKNKVRGQNNCYCSKNVVQKTKKCQPAAGDMADLIKTDHVPNSRLARHKKISERKIQNYKIVKRKNGKRTKICQTSGLAKKKNDKKKKKKKTNHKNN